MTFQWPNMLWLLALLHLYIGWRITPQLPGPLGAALFVVAAGAGAAGQGRRAGSAEGRGEAHQACSRARHQTDRKSVGRERVSSPV